MLFCGVAEDAGMSSLQSARCSTTFQLCWRPLPGDCGSVVALSAVHPVDGSVCSKVLSKRTRDLEAQQRQILKNL